MEIALVFLMGIVVGSFLNVLVDRLPRSESVLKGRSHCESCHKTLKWYDLIPLFSFIQLKGRCRYCHFPLSFYYPLVELATGLIFIAIALFVVNNFQSNINISIGQMLKLGYYLFVASSLIVVFFADLKYGIIPDKIIFPSVLVSFLYIILTANYIIPIFAGTGAFLFFLIIFLITRGRGMGFGDVKLAFLIGIFLGFPKIIAALYIAFLVGAVVGILFLIIKKKKLAGATIPFGPFLVVGTFIALFWGKYLIEIFL